MIEWDVQGPPGWHEGRPHRFFGNEERQFVSPDRGSVIEVTVRREPRRSRELPLDLLAEALLLQDGRSFGIHNELLGTDHIVVADRSAAAATARRTHGPQERLESLVVLRIGEEWVAILALHTGVDAPAEVVLAWAWVLGSLTLPPAPEVGPFLEEAEIEQELDRLEQVP